MYQCFLIPVIIKSIAQFRLSFPIVQMPCKFPQRALQLMSPLGPPIAEPTEEAPMHHNKFLSWPLQPSAERTIAPMHRSRPPLFGPLLILRRPVHPDRKRLLMTAHLGHAFGHAVDPVVSRRYNW